MNYPLQIELIPRTSFFKNVRSEVSQREWDTLRKKVYKRNNHKCEICNGKGYRHPVECHEKWHYNFETNVQKLIGLEALCPNCHKVKHIGLALSQGRGDRSIKHLMKVNGISENDAIAYIEQVFQDWEYKSQFNWILDLSYLNEFIQ